jgi:hypothetical protein
VSEQEIREFEKAAESPNSEAKRRRRPLAKKHKRRKRPRPELPPELQRYRKVSVPWAAEIKNLSVDTFRRHFGHLIEQASPRRQVVSLAKLLDE